MGGREVHAVVFDVMDTMVDMSPLVKRMEAKGFTKDATLVITSTSVESVRWQ